MCAFVMLLNLAVPTTVSVSRSHLQADSWKIVSAADDKTLKVNSLFVSCFSLFDGLSVLILEQFCLFLKEVKE